MVKAYKQSYHVYAILKNYCLLNVYFLVFFF